MLLNTEKLTKAVTGLVWTPLHHRKLNRTFLCMPVNFCLTKLTQPCLYGLLHWGTVMELKRAITTKLESYNWPICLTMVKPTLELVKVN